MTAFLGISVWITLATVIPGLMTIAAVSGAFLLISPYISGWGIDKELVGWSTPAFLITVMVLTQTTGILLENIQVNNHLLGRKEFEVTIPAGIDPLGETSITIRPYDEYRGLYLLLAELRNDEDSQGHLQRCIAQFFLTTNSIISFVAGIITTLALIILSHGPRTVPGLLFLTLLIGCLALSIYIQRIRFRVMAMALWAARRRRLESARSALNVAALAMN